MGTPTGTGGENGDEGEMGWGRQGMKEGKGHVPRSAHTCRTGADLTSDITGMWGKVQLKPKATSLRT